MNLVKNGGARKHRKLRDLMSAVFTLCALDNALTTEVLDELIADSRDRAAKNVARLKPHRRGSVDLDALGHVVYRWQRLPAYLDDDGLPLHIPARGPAPSIEALFREIDKKRYFELGLKHLRQVGRVRRSRNGLYSPCAEVSIVQSLTPELVELLAQTINRVVTTVLHNTSLKERNAIRLIERVTAVPDLHRSQISDFKLFAREQGGALINTMNDWLESRRGGSKARRSNTTDHLTAGLHVFAFVEKNKK